MKWPGMRVEYRPHGRCACHSVAAAASSRGPSCTPRGPHACARRARSAVTPAARRGRALHAPNGATTAGLARADTPRPAARHQAGATGSGGLPSDGCHHPHRHDRGGRAHADATRCRVRCGRPHRRGARASPPRRRSRGEHRAAPPAGSSSKAPAQRPSARRRRGHGAPAPRGIPQTPNRLPPRRRWRPMPARSARTGAGGRVQEAATRGARWAEFRAARCARARRGGGDSGTADPAVAA